MSRPVGRLGLAVLAVLLGAAAPRPTLGADLRAGFGVEPLPATPDAPLGGYGGWRDRRATGGVLDPPEARALVLDRGEVRVALVAVDLVIARPSLRDPLLAEAEPLEIDVLVLVATHTHSGPGGYLPGLLAARATSGSFDPEMPDRLVQAATRALQRAVESLARARVASTTAELELARNRRVEAGPRETALPVLRIDFEESRPSVVLFAYGMHPTVRSRQSRAYSADYVGAARAWLDAQGWRSLFVPGALGDQGPSSELGPLWPGDLELEDRQTREIGQTLGQAVHRAALGLETTAGADLMALERWIDPPPVRMRRFCTFWWLAPLIGGSVRSFFSTRVPLHAVRIGEARLLALPAEPDSTVGEEIRSRAPRSPAPFLVAHANDWIGYVVSAERYRRGGYEACFSFHGEGAAAWLVDESVETLRLMEQRQREQRDAARYNSRSWATRSRW